MKKAKGGAAKEKEKKKMKLEQAAHNCSQNISNMFNVMTKKTSILESQDNKFIHPPVLLQPDNISESYDEDQQEYLIDNPEDSLITTQAVLHSVNIPRVHVNEKQEDLVGNTHNSGQSVQLGTMNNDFIPEVHEDNQEIHEVNDVVQLSSTSLQGPSDISLVKNDKPVQPDKLFPATNGRRFSSKFYEMYNWIEYSVANDPLFCFPCRHFSATLIAYGQSTNQICFVDYSSKCKNWKEITKCLVAHNRYERHIISTQRWNDYQLVQRNTSHSVVNQLINCRQQNINENRNHLHFLLKAALYLSKQGLAFRGHNESKFSKNKGNFIEILEMFASDDIKLRLQARYGHYTSPAYQNDFISIIATLTRQNILSAMNKLGVYTIMVDETKDLSKKEQMSFFVKIRRQGFEHL